MKVGIVGAGVCGLSAARTLNRSGHQVTLFEKNRRVGGRVATYSQAGYIWDTGATSIAPRGKAIEQVLLHEFDTTDLVLVEKPIFQLQAMRIVPGARQAQTARYTYRPGIATFPKLLAEGLDIRLGTQVETIEKSPSGFQILGSDFDAIILTPPIPRTSALLWSLEERRPLASVFYRSCLNVALGYSTAPPDLHFHALLNTEPLHPLTWLSVESVKSPGRCPEGGSAFCAQLSPKFSADNYLDSEEDLIQLAALYVSRLFGDDFASPKIGSVKRWKYSQPESLANIDDVNPPGSKVLIASDSLLGGHTEDAFEVGKMVAERLIADIG